jgi:PHS family inorganic phosphate transporter-like MFS transporter
MKVATPIGTVIGATVFGYLADRIGRKRMYGIELLIIIVTTALQALVCPALALNLVGTIMFWRVMMGVGIGGDYPLSAIITSE